MSTKQKKTSKFTNILIIVGALLTVGVAVNTFISVYLMRENKEQDDNHVAALIIDSVEGMSRPIPVDITGTYYIPTAKLTLPAPDPSLGEVLYSYAPEVNDFDEEVHLVSKNAIRAAEYPLRNAGNNVKDVFDAVPKLQSCARGVKITFKPQQGQKLETTKLLADGRTAHFYAEDLCRNTKLIDFARAIESN